MPLMQGGESLRVEQKISMGASDHTKTHRRVVRPKNRCARLADTFSQCLGHNGHTVDIAGLALICTKPQSRISLHMLDRFKAFACCHFYAGRSDIILHVNKLLWRSTGGLGMRHQIQRHWITDNLIGTTYRRWSCRQTLIDACRQTRVSGNLNSINETIGQGLSSVDSPAFKALFSRRPW